jgi:hypothetical protein
MVNFLAILEGRDSDLFTHFRKKKKSTSLLPHSSLPAFPYNLSILSQYSVFTGQNPAHPCKVLNINPLRPHSPFPSYLQPKN